MPISKFCTSIWNLQGEVKRDAALRRETRTDTICNLIGFENRPAAASRVAGNRGGSTGYKGTRPVTGL